MINTWRTKMIKACDLETGGVIRFNTIPHIVENIQVQTPSARGAATLYKVRFRSMQNRGKLDKVFRGDDALENCEVEKREVQFLYEKDDRFEFMDLVDYSQFAMAREDIQDAVPFLVENMEGIEALVSDDKVLAIELPAVVELDVVECDPSIKGASATARTKPAKLSTGHMIQVPEYMAAGERVRVDTRSGKFLSRA
jgi:elongation factor P